MKFFFDTGSPIPIIPSMTNPKEIQLTTKRFVDVNKNHMKFRGEARVEFKTGEKQKTTKTNNGKQKHRATVGTRQARQTGDRAPRKKYNIIRNTNTDERSEKILNEYEDLFKINHTI